MKLTTPVHSRGCGNPLYPATTTPKFPTPTAGGRSNYKAATALAKGARWTLDTSRLGKGERLLFIMLLTAAAPSHAAGVCIVCPPGHTCPAGNAPVISGAEGQILRRTETGMEWTDLAGIFQNPQGATGLHVCAFMRMAGIAPVQWTCSSSSTTPPTGHNPQTTGSHCWCRFRSSPEGVFSCPASRWVFEQYRPGNGFYNCEIGCQNACTNNSPLWRAHAAW